MDKASTINYSINALLEFTDAYIGNPFSRDTIINRHKAEQNIRSWLEDGIAVALNHIIKACGYRGYEKFMLALFAYKAADKRLSYKKGLKKLYPNQTHEMYKDLLSIADFETIGINAMRLTQYLKEDVAGNSKIINEIKKRTWSACFGKDLSVALYNRGLIRGNNVLIRGESGVGKELFAQAVIKSDMGGENYGNGKTLAINLASISKGLISFELFGSVKGAFTGATDKDGILKKVNGGSIFLDEIGDIPTETQVGLLRAIENQIIFKLGDDKPVAIDVRCVTATNKDIANPDNFRNDLYQRIAGIELLVPPLKERKEDIVEIGRYLDRKERGKKTQLIRDSNEPIDEFLIKLQNEDYNWPGNVRELKRQVDNIRLGLPTILDDRKKIIISASPTSEHKSAPYSTKSIEQLGYTIKELTYLYIRHAVDRTDHNMSKAAKLLGVDRTTVMRRYEEKNG